MRQINTHVFQAAATIYEALLGHKDNKVPHDPAYAVEAVEIAEILYTACKNDAVYTMAAARCLCGFKKNTESAHCTQQELVNLALLGASQLVDAFSNSRTPVPVQQPRFSTPVNNHPPPQMPPPPMAQMPQPPAPAPFVAPVVPVDVPDFTGGT